MTSAERHLPRTWLTPITAADSEKLRLWRNLPRVRANSFDQREISAEDQQHWFAGLAGDSSRRYLLFGQNDKAIGCLSFTAITATSAHWGCYLGEEQVWPGTGLLIEIAALDYAEQMLGLATLHAEVLAHNPGPAKVHRLFGYTEGEPRQHRFADGREEQVLCFSYPLGHWTIRRPRVLATLPASVQEAADQIYLQPFTSRG